METMTPPAPPSAPELVAGGSGVDKMVVEPIVLVMTESPDVMTVTMPEVVIGTPLEAASEPVALADVRMRHTTIRGE